MVHLSSDDKFYYLIQEVIEFVNINTITVNEHDAIEVVNIEDLPYRFFRQFFLNFITNQMISYHNNEYCKFDLPSKQKTLIKLEGQILESIAKCY